MNGNASMLSIIVPVLDEETSIATALFRLRPFLARGAELVVVDGGSLDGTVAAARPYASRVVIAPRGRGAQLAAGAVAAAGTALVFLHADTELPDDADRLIAAALASRAWGRFDVAIAGGHPVLAVVAAMMNLRSRLTGIATGDQAMFMTKAAYAAAGGVPDIALMEDIALSKRLKRIGRPACLKAKVTTSGRRWQRHGVARTIFLMWSLRFLYWAGAPPDLLARWYGYRPRG
ncbi:TIGR04283 family arsenosugar biosynthesis glycosyltransferase [Blastochloris viridis]|nr:TIGR04283 family arsenosugar biosynthesis glycosyltransferase [Blastochloris viridis]